MKVSDVKLEQIDGLSFWKLRLACGCIRHVRAINVYKQHPPMHLRCEGNHAADAAGPTAGRKPSIILMAPPAARPAVSRSGVPLKGGLGR